jgi:hypothetical protein
MATKGPILVFGTVLLAALAVAVFAVVSMRTRRPPP